MRIAVLHSFYRTDAPSGENLVVERQVESLRRRGHDVTLIARHSDTDRATRWAALRAGWDVATGRGFDPLDILTRFAPDVVHVHNFFPNFATRWLAHWKGPLVATVHNYRWLCANALLLREDAECTLCPDGDRWAGVRHRCYRDSRMATVPLALRNRHGLPLDPVVARADRIIVLSERAREVFTRYGAPPARLRLVPNGIPDVPGPSPASPQSGAWVAVGRLSPEKGLRQLLRDWPEDHRLDIVGTGPEEQRLRDLRPPGVRLLGLIPNKELRGRLSGYSGMVLPGVAPEGAYPLNAVEALAAGLPLLARSGGAGADMVQRWGCGMIYSDRTTLLSAIQKSQDAGFSGRSRQTFEREFTESRWLDRLEQTYRELPYER